VKNKLFIITIILTLLGNVSNAENFNYDYVELRIGTTNSDANEKEIYGFASKSINNNFSIRGGFYYSYGDWTKNGKYREQDGKGFSLEGVFNKEISSNTDLVISTGYSLFSAKSICTSLSRVCSTSSNTSNETNIYTASIGFKQQLSSSILMEAHYRGIEFEEATTGVTQGNLILMKELSNTISIGIDYSWNITRNDFNRTMVILRREF